MMLIPSLLQSQCTYVKLQYGREEHVSGTVMIPDSISLLDFCGWILALKKKKKSKERKKEKKTTHTQTCQMKCTVLRLKIKISCEDTALHVWHVTAK